MIGLNSPPLYIPKREIIRPPKTGLICPPRFRSPCKRATMIQPMRRGSAEGGGGAPTITYVNTAQSTPLTTTHDMGDFVIPADGLVVVCAIGTGGSTRALSSLTVGGASGTVVIGPTGDIACGIGTCEKSAGTHNVTVVWSSSCARCVVFVYVIENLVSATASDSEGDNTDGTSASLSAVTIPANGAAIFVCGTQVDEAHAWSGGPTEDDEVAYENDRHSAASMTSVAGETPTATCSWTSSSGQAICGASWA